MQTNARKPEQIKRWLEWASFCCGGEGCEECRFWDMCGKDKLDQIAPDILAYVKRLEEKVKAWDLLGETMGVRIPEGRKC